MTKRLFRRVLVICHTDMKYNNFRDTLLNCRFSYAIIIKTFGGFGDLLHNSRYVALIEHIILVMLYINFI